MINKNIFRLLAAVIVLFLPIIVFSQKTLIYEDAGFKVAYDLFEKQKYVAAQQKFNDLKNSDAPASLKSDAEYYAALCAIELFNADAEYLLTKFLENNPESDKIRTAYFQMGRFMYRDKKYKNAVKWFEKVDKYELKKDDLAEFYFKTGYSNFVLNDYEKAVKSFYEIKDSDSEYADAATYYYSHINYTNQNYETALIGFTKLKSNEQFAPVVPYYICQIYYLQEKYDKVIEFAPALLDSATAKRGPEIARIIGEAYYRTQKYAEAIPYLLRYYENTDVYKREDTYQLAYAFYKVSDFRNAARYFEEVLNYNDKLSQNVFYHLADCYLRLGEKQKARMAFASAAKYNFDDIIKEDAQYNYAKLTFELSFYPFNEGIKAFKEYIELYPQSNRIQESYQFLVKAYMNTKNYKDALSSMDLINDKKDEIKEAYQRAAFFRALELFKNLDFSGAIEYFNKSLQYSFYNKNYTALSNYWKGEGFYRQKNFDSSIVCYKKFLECYGAFQHPEFEMTYYNMGYCYFNQKDYKESLLWFRKYEKECKNKKSKFYADASNRAGDCYFSDRKYNEAIPYYTNAVDINLIDVDYALYQRGLSFGLLKKHEEKINSMQKLVTDFPKSAYIDDAIFEMARSYYMTEQNEQAIKSYNRIISEFPNSGYIKKSLLELGQIYRNNDQYEDAIKAYKRIINEDKNTAEAVSAMLGLKNVYMDKNDINTYFEYAKEHGDITDIRQTEKDSMMYHVAETQYMDGDCKKARESLRSYLAEFPDGMFALNAYYYKAECDYKDNNIDEALVGYSVVASKPKSIFSEPALLKASTLNFELKKYDDAYKYFVALEKIAEVKNNLMIARQGQMRASFLAGNFAAASEAANKLMITDKLSDENVREALFILAQSLFAQNRLDEALPRYRILAKETKSSEGAESKYKIALIHYIQGADSTSQTEIYNFVEMNTSHQYWLAKSFILLADIFIRQKDDFQAKQTLQSIIENYSVTTDEIITEANDRIVKIVEREKELRKAKDTLKVEEPLNFNQEEKDKQLFETSPGAVNDTLKQGKNEILQEIEEREKPKEEPSNKDAIIIE